VGYERQQARGCNRHEGRMLDLPWSSLPTRRRRGPLARFASRVLPQNRRSCSTTIASMMSLRADGTSLLIRSPRLTRNLKRSPKTLTTLQLPAQLRSFTRQSRLYPSMTIRPTNDGPKGWVLTVSQSENKVQRSSTVCTPAPLAPSLEGRPALRVVWLRPIRSGLCRDRPDRG
jgi:hypothetical protein